MKLNKLENLNNTISILEEMGNLKQADELHNYFIKLAAKKKSKEKKNVPNNPSLWAECKAWAKRTFDVYPSAYANGAAAKRYKSKGGTWKKASVKNNVKVAQAYNTDPYMRDYEGSSPNQGYAAKLPPSVPAKESDYGMGLLPPEEKKIVNRDRWSDYYNVDYTTVIQVAKRLLQKGEKESAKNLINAVSQNSQLLTGAQKEALKKHFERILMAYTELGTSPSAVMNNAYSDANNLLFTLKRKYNLKDEDLKIGSPSYGLVMNDINKYISPVRNPDLTRRTKQIALQLLRNLSMDIRSKR